MKLLPKVILIAAHSPRSQAYVQALSSNGLMPAHVLLLGEEPLIERTTPPAENFQGILLPDLSISLTETLSNSGVPYTHLESRDVNSPDVLAAVIDLSPNLIIYSGYGGQIVKPPLIQLGIPILHIHSGWLPEYRGSTTIYYSLIQERHCAASAILLDIGIDTGPIVAQKRYPAPPLGTDIDQRYDTAIRADLLFNVLKQYETTEKLDIISHQNFKEGSNYYVIHPVLKHLALLSLPSGVQN